MRVYPAFEDLGLDPDADKTPEPPARKKRSPGGCRLRSFKTTPHKKVGIPIMTDIQADENGAFTGDRYERLKKSAEVLASDPSMVGGEPPYNADGIRAFAKTVEQLRLLDGLTDYDANTVSLLVALDFIQGPRRMAWRVWDMLTDAPQTPHRDHDDEIAVVHTMVGILHMVIGAWLPPDPWRVLNRLAADTNEAYEMVKLKSGNSGDHLKAAIDNIDDAIGSLP
ncbi:hypothetical protein [Mycolicibacterium bacteremicum]|uniref:hypothetical protein n=1 Tax=Mycolicibacterium bacteremicum TaxID=564198 RepID=UPI0026EC71B9|nr:hypothetical protein [Mycolicibacterium bacteremicum]